MSLWLEPAVFPVLLDSCVLYPYELRDLLLEAAHEHLYRVHWSRQILEDTVRNLLADGRTNQEQAARFVAAMNRAFPEALVEPPAGLADPLGCDPGDRHVLAAAIVAKAEVIVTLNVRHFPKEVLAPLGIEAVSPAEFLCNLLAAAARFKTACRPWRPDSATPRAHPWHSCRSSAARRRSLPAAACSLRSTSSTKTARVWQACPWPLAGEVVSMADPQPAAPVQPGNSDLLVNDRDEEMEACGDRPRRTIREEDVKMERVSSEPPLRKLASTGFWVGRLGKYTTICTTTFPGLQGMGWDLGGRRAGSILLALFNAWGR